MHRPIAVRFEVPRGRACCRCGRRLSVYGYRTGRHFGANGRRLLCGGCFRREMGLPPDHDLRNLSEAALSVLPQEGLRRCHAPSASA
jgi:hypothetical protein